MKRLWIPILLTGMLFLSLPVMGQASSQDSAVTAAADNRVVICPLEGMVDDGMAVVVSRAVKEAAGAKAIVFVIDTFGGRVDSAFKIVDSITSAPCPTIAYIKGKGAISAGALISFACKDIFMARSAVIGACQPVIMTQQGALPTGEKEVSVLRSKITALAELNGHNPDIGRAMVDKDIALYAARDASGKIRVWAVQDKTSPASGLAGALREVIKQGLDTVEKQTGTPMDAARKALEAPAGQDEDSQPGATHIPSGDAVDVGPEPTLILPSGKLLTWSAQEAVKYGLVRLTASNVNQVLGIYDLQNARQDQVTMTIPEKIFRFLTNPTVSGILFMLAIGGLYLEIKTPGFGLPGIISIVAFTLFFGARAVLGIADWIDLVLILAGVALLLLEFFVIPGFGLAGMAGIACLLAGLYFSFTLNDFEWPRYQWQFDRARDAGVAFVTASILLLLLFYATWKLLPHTPVYNRMVLGKEQVPDEGYVVQTKEEEQAIGQEGIAISKLRPAGKAQFGDKIVQVMSRGDFIEPGTKIVIVEVEGNRYVVQPKA